LKSESSDVLARELNLNDVTVLQLHRKIQENAKLLESEEPVPDFEWARDEEGDGAREVRANTAEGMQTGLRNFLCPFRGVHKKRLCSWAV
jgi:hypothetical protein